MPLDLRCGKCDFLIEQYSGRHWERYINRSVRHPTIICPNCQTILGFKSYELTADKVKDQILGYAPIIEKQLVEALV